MTTPATASNRHVTVQHTVWWFFSCFSAARRLSFVSDCTQTSRMSRGGWWSIFTVVSVRQCCSGSSPSTPCLLSSILRRHLFAASCIWTIRTSWCGQHRIVVCVLEVAGADREYLFASGQNSAHCPTSTTVLEWQSVWQILRNLVHKPSSTQKTAVIRHKQSLSVVNRTWSRSQPGFKTKFKLPFNRRQTICKCVYLVVLVQSFWSCDLDLDPMGPDIRIWPKYLHDVPAWQKRSF